MESSNTAETELAILEAMLDRQRMQFDDLAGYNDHDEIMREIIQKAWSQRMLVLNLIAQPNSSYEFHVLGSTGNFYHVYLGEYMTCTCLKFTYDQTYNCKHILFVLLKACNLDLLHSLVMKKKNDPTTLEERESVIANNTFMYDLPFYVHDRVRENIQFMIAFGSRDINMEGFLNFADIVGLDPPRDNIIFRAPHPHPHPHHRRPRHRHRQRNNNRGGFPGGGGNPSCSRSNRPRHRHRQRNNNRGGFQGGSGNSSRSRSNRPRRRQRQHNNNRGGTPGGSSGGIPGSSGGDTPSQSS